jgi:hypothetical protein
MEILKQDGDKEIEWIISQENKTNQHQREVKNMRKIMKICKKRK